MAQRYKLDTGLWKTDPAFYDSQGEAWNDLRLIIPNKFATLYVEENVHLPVLNEQVYVNAYFDKYGTHHGDGRFTPIDNDPRVRKIWRPVLIGITSHDYEQPTLNWHTKQ